MNLATYIKLQMKSKINKKKTVDKKKSNQKTTAKIHVCKRFATHPKYKLKTLYQHKP